MGDSVIDFGNEWVNDAEALRLTTIHNEAVADRHEAAHINYLNQRARRLRLVEQNAMADEDRQGRRLTRGREQIERNAMGTEDANAPNITGGETEEEIVYPTDITTGAERRTNLPIPPNRRRRPILSRIRNLFRMD